jgi:isopenicillin-N epimerase
MTPSAPASWPGDAQPMPAEPDWLRVRDSMMLDPTVTYLNSGSAGPLASTVYDRVTGLRRRLAEEPLDFLVRDAPDLLSAARSRLAEFIGGDPSRLVLTTNVTGAVNLLASGLSLDAPGEILLTDHEYTPMRWGWERAAKRQGLVVRTLRLPTLPAVPAEIVDAAAAALSPRVRLFFFSHVLSTTGMVLPVKQLCAAARAHGVLTVVDGAHGPTLTDLNLADLGCDYYVGACHKWLLAPIGTAFLYFDIGKANRLEPMQVGWGYQSVQEDGPLQCDEFGRTPTLRGLEIEGTRDICPWLVLPEAIGFQAELGHRSVRKRIRELAGHVRNRLTGVRGLVPLTPEHPELHAGLTAFRVPDATDAVALRRRLWQQYRIEIAAIQAPDRSLIRVSTHFFNTAVEVERLADALAELI